MAYINVKNITKRFDDKLILDNISFEINQGDIFGLIGPNGAGKSTLINIMTDILRADSGDTEIGGFSVKKQPILAKGLIGLVPQEIALMKDLNAYDNLEYIGAFYGLSGKLLKERINEALAVTGLSDRKKDKVKKYSGGMQRRLNLAAAIMHKPRVLIMDEPTVGVDPQSRNYIFEFIKKINKENNTTIIYTSHYMEEVDSLCSSIFILDSGKEIAKGTKDTIKNIASVHGTVVLTLDSFDDELILNMKKINGVKDVHAEDEKITIFINENEFELQSMLILLNNSNKKIKKLSAAEASLEEVFLSLTGKKLRD